VDWLVTAALALVHGAAEEVRAGSMGSEQALAVLVATTQELLTAGSARRDDAVHGAGGVV
jgi:hypothetical protein